MKRALALVGTLVLMASLLLPLSAGADSIRPQSAGATPAVPPAQPPRPYAGQVTTATDRALAKIHPNLREKARAGGEALVPVNVFLRPGADVQGLTALFDRPIVRTILGTTSIIGQVPARNLLKLAASEGVDVVLDPMPYTPPPRTPDPDMPQRITRARETIRARLEGTISHPTERAGTEGWWDVGEGHRSSYAWANGYTGQGVKVAVIDTGVDFAHPDLQGTWAVYPLTSTTIPPTYTQAYGGWPIAFDDLSMMYYALSGGPVPGTWYADTSYTVSVTPTITTTIIFDGKTFTVAGSLSGVYHIGYHPDTSLSAWWYGEPVAVLVVDENIAGTYDTVYVDLDDDYDFTNEKPVTRDDPVAWKDFDDGYADVSGGLVYFIADGLHHPPGFDWLWGPFVPSFDPPAAGNMVAFMLNNALLAGGDHGTLCASNVAGQGMIDGGAPPYKPIGVGGMVQGGGRNAKVWAMGCFYCGGYETDYYFMTALGYDGLPLTGDEPEIVSMSYGSTATDNDGWDWTSRFLTWLNLFVAPYTSYVGSTGNGAPAYGTVNSPNPVTGVSVGASTQYDSCGAVFDLITSTEQLLWGDLQSWSDVGPGADGSVGVSVLANGAWGAGDLPLNEWGDGWTAWECWGGTSRSAPVAAGNLALIYDAYYQAHGEYPTWDVARAILMSGANDALHDPLRQGAGTVNAERATWVAGGDYGFYVLPDSWSAGDYRGENFLSFANIVHPGDSSSQAFTLVNDSAFPITVTLSDGYFTLVGEEEWTFTTDNALEQRVWAKPDYLFTATQWVETGGPYEGADLMVAKLAFPYRQFSLDDPATPPQTYNSRWRVLIYDWTDLNGDGNLWTDLNGDGVVQSGEIDTYEYNRYGYGYNSGTTMQQSARDPSHRYHDGLYVGVEHRTASGEIPTTTIELRVSFYKRVDWPWLETSVSSLTIPAGGTASFTATLSVPPTVPLGLYQSEILVQDPGYLTYTAHTAVVPVVVSVAADGPTFSFGGVDQDLPYDNGTVGGFFDWAWRAESGDWRFFFADIPDDHGLPEGTNFLVHTVWSNYPTDLDTLIFGPTPDEFSADDPEFYGPYALYKVGGSENTYLGSGRWLFRTNTGTTEEWIAAPLQAGLHLFALHNVLFNPEDETGHLWKDIPFSGTVGTLAVTPSPVEVWTTSFTGDVLMEALSSMSLPGITATAYGLSQPLLWTHEPITPAAGLCDWSYDFTVTNAAYIEATTSSPDVSDNDLYLYWWDGASWVQIAASTGPTAEEYIRVLLPADGLYRLCLDDWAGVPGHFDLTLFAPAGTGLWTSDVPTGTLEPGVPVHFTLNYSATMTPGDWYGVILAGPPVAPSAVLVPVIIHYAQCFPVEEADFTWSPTTPTVGLMTLFTATVAPPTATTPITYTWDFGDGHTAVVTTPTALHTYTATGTYTVTLTVENACGMASAEHVLTVEVAPPPEFKIYLPLVFKGYAAAP